MCFISNLFRTTLVAQIVLDPSYAINIPKGHCQQVRKLLFARSLDFGFG